MKYKIKKEQKEALIKIIDKVAEGKPYLFQEVELSEDEIEVIIIASSFSASQLDELQNIDLTNITTVSKGSADAAFDLFDD